MRIKSRKFGTKAEGDMTPMIDMTFQLIAFFMVLINFTEVETDERVVLPISEMAKPPETPLDRPITIQVTADGKALIGGDEMEVGGQLELALNRERRVLGRLGRSPASVPVIIRAHKDAKTGKVQEIIEYCQGSQFEKFRLRAEQEIEGQNDKD